MDSVSALNDLRFPTGRFSFDGEASEARRSGWIDTIEATPARLRAAVEGLTPSRLEAPYRPGGWTVRQLVHHVPDSHMNAYIRFKLALTEEEPTVKGYDEAKWAELADTRDAPVEASLRLLESLHVRWVALLRAMTRADFDRSFRHPELGRTLSLLETLGLYAWHGPHHVAHIERLREREGW